MTKFEKIPTSNPDYIRMKENHLDVYEEFESYAQYLTDKADKAKKASGKARSYARYMIKMLVLYNNIFHEEIENLISFSTIQKLENLKALADFKAFNQQENRFPNAAINCFIGYIKFKKNEIIEENVDLEFNEELLQVHENKTPSKANDLAEGPVKRPDKEENRGIHTFPRSLAESLEAKKRANFICEVDSTHTTFKTVVDGNSYVEVDGNSYVEAHHLIPMSTQLFFEYTIDFADNIIALCPTCHRKIHHATDEVKKELVEQLYERRKELYISHGIEIDLEMLLSFY